MARFREVEDHKIEEIISAHEIWLNDSNGDGAQRADFSGLMLHGKSFSRRKLELADFSSANVQEADFSHAHLSGASFEAATCLSTKFNGSRLLASDFTRAVLDEAVFEGATVTRASFDRARLSGVTGLDLDSNSIEGTIFGDSQDAWSTLRQTYTGVNLFVFFALFAIFLIPYLAKAVALMIASEVGKSIPGSLSAPNASEHSLLWVLIGGEQAHWILGQYGFVLSVFVILFVFARTFLTYRVSLLSGSVDRNRKAPAASTLSWMRAVHNCLFYLKFVAFAAVVINVAQLGLVTVTVAR